MVSIEHMLIGWQRVLALILLVLLYQLDHCGVRLTQLPDRPIEELY